MSSRIALTAALLSVGIALATSPVNGAEKLRFNRDIRPILSDNCYRCHGFDKSSRQADLRLDIAEGAFADRGGGVKPIVPGMPGDSELLRRLTTDDPDERMPPAETHQSVTKSQIEILRRWIEEGAEYEPHWAFIRPSKPPLPPIESAQILVRNGIDHFIADKLATSGLSMSAEADKVTLLRRVTLDLIGLPPTREEVDAFLSDNSSDAYEKVVERLLTSPHYGERMALPWLDAARYADSNGFQQDGDTFQYVWRDWLVRALNANMPFDQFTIEQLAGDLLPNASDDQRLATGFNRLHMLNGEGGAIAEEQRNVIVHDRVDVTSTTWLALTMTCCQCHDHKYDPVTQKDYYQFFAYFNNVPETGGPAGSGKYRIAEPSVYVSTDESIPQIRALEGKLADASKEVQRLENSEEMVLAQRTWESTASEMSDVLPKLDPWHAIGPFSNDTFDATFETAYGPERKIDLKKKYQDGSVSWTQHPEWENGKVYELKGINSATYLYRTIYVDGLQPMTLSFGSDDGIKVWLNDALIVKNKVVRAAAPDQESVFVTLPAGKNKLLVKIVNEGGLSGFYFDVTSTGLTIDLKNVVLADPKSRSPEDAKRLQEYFTTHFPSPVLAKAREQEATIRKQLDKILLARPRVMVMSDAGPRKSHILLRGNYEMPGEEVIAATPSAIAPLQTSEPQNRLSLAKWLVSEENPLTARVQVNRYWQLFFGKGLVKTSENFGLQSEQPTHPELLDWLAVEFRESGWNVKHIHKLIVTSATYRQSSRILPELLQRDPENVLYARGPRFRLPSLILRDVALSASGLLDKRIGGEPVYPYQPKDIWDGLAITKERDFTYPISKDRDLFRRSLYTFWRRTVAPGNMFDASVRNVCNVRPSITSTPLHALTTLNDVTWVEAGRALAETVLKQSSADPDLRLAEAFRRVCARKPSANELVLLRRMLARSLAEFRNAPQAAVEYLSHGASPRDLTLDAAEHAAYATVCLAIFNLDEALTKE